MGLLTRAADVAKRLRGEGEPSRKGRCRSKDSLPRVFGRYIGCMLRKRAPRLPAAIYSRVFTALWIGFSAWVPVASGQTPARARTATTASGLTAEDVIKLVKAGLSEDIIIQQIKKNGRAFDL